MAQTISNLDDVIDSRDVIARIEEIEDERTRLADEADEADEATRQAAAAALQEWDASDEGAELRALRALAEEASDAEDWTYGATLVRDSYFQTYAMELADDIGAVPDNAGWPLTCIDWDKAARDLRVDYTAVDFDGTTYWVR